MSSPRNGSFDREPTNPGFVAYAPPAAPGEANGWLDSVPLWAKVLGGILLTGTVPAGVAAMLPFATKDSMVVEVEAREDGDAALQVQIDEIKRELPKSIVKELKEQGFLRKR